MWLNWMLSNEKVRQGEGEIRSYRKISIELSEWIAEEKSWEIRGAEFNYQNLIVI
jgi:hypothetical protein